MPNSVEKLASQTMGALKDVKAGFKGLTGVFMHLMEEHGRVWALMKRVATSSDVDVHAKLYPTIRTELLAHERGELRAVYPVLAEYAATSAIAIAHSRHASELEAAIAEVDALAFGDAGWRAAFEHLTDLVEQHVAMEEGEYFPKAQAALGKERADALLPSFEAAKKLG